MEVELHAYNVESAQRQIEALNQVRRERHSREVARTLAALEKAAKEGANVMPPLVECCKAYATVGEMTAVFRNTYGEFEEPGLF